MKRIRIALVGDYDEKVHTHVALNEAIAHARPRLSLTLEVEWVPTEALTPSSLPLGNDFHGIWIVPGSPYKNDAGVYDVIQHARQNNTPIVGNCGGFQYMLIEYARNVLNIRDASHEESDPGVSNVISKLSCSLKGQQEQVRIADKTSWLYGVLKTDSIIGKYYCSYGVNPTYQEKLGHFPMVFTAFSPTGEIRAFELKNHRFYKGTLFQPALDSTWENPNPLIVSFFKNVYDHL